VHANFVTQNFILKNKFKRQLTKYTKHKGKAMNVVFFFALIPRVQRPSAFLGVLLLGIIQE
jgi:hypothetical protein